MMSDRSDFPPLSVLFAGSGAFGLPTLRALTDSPATVVHVYSQPDRPAGRGRKLTPTPISQFALDLGLPLTRTNDLNAEPLPQADVLVVIAFGQKIAPHITSHPRLGAINLHSSLLPKYRGAAPINAAVLNGETTTGNSVIRLAPKMDAGAILGQSLLTIGDAETAGELHDRLADDGPHLVARVLRELADGSAVEREQDHAQASIAPKLSRADAVLDFTRHATGVASKINGLSPWPGCRVTLQFADGQPGETVTLLRARAVRCRPAEPGTLAQSDDTPEPVIATIDGGVQILDLQPQGRKPMTLTAYRNGRPWDVEMRVVSAEG